jgi:hypothetical protein
MYKDLVEKIVSKMPTDLNDMEKARYIYMKLGLLFTFDENYMLGTNATQKKLIFKAEKGMYDFKEMAQKGKIKTICISMIDTYVNALRKVGISAKSYQESEYDPHRTAVVTIDGVEFQADLKCDLVNIQSRKDTKFFGKDVIDTRKQVIPGERLDQIDKKLFGRTSKEQEIVKKIEELQKKYKRNDKRLSYMIEEALDEIANLEMIKDMEFSERSSFVSWFLKKVIPEQAKPRMIENYFYTKEDDQEEPRDNFEMFISAMDFKDRYVRFGYDESLGRYTEIPEHVFLERIAGKCSYLGKKVLTADENKVVNEDNEKDEV